MNEHFDTPQLTGRVRRVLDHGTATLDKRILSRLYESRQLALARQAQPVVALSLAGIGQSIGHFVSEPLSRRLRAVMAVVALLAGAAGVEFWQNSQKAAELAEIDSALLADEVSPSAYLDQGFVEWLRRIAQEQEQDGSLPQ
jgi:hypothetical protein